MLPEGVGRRRAFVKTGTAAPLTNELLENSKLAVEKLWKQRGYDPKKPEVIKARLGYADPVRPKPYGPVTRPTLR